MKTYEILTSTFSKLIKANSEEEAIIKFKQIFDDEIRQIQEYTWMGNNQD